MKRIICFLLVIVMLSSIFLVGTITANASTNGKTQAQAISWCESQLGKALDYDGAYGAQCVDFIRYYYQLLGQSASGNANAYQTSNCPSGWSRIAVSSNTALKAGDIAVYKVNANVSGYTTSEYGHVAVIASDVSSGSTTMTVYQQNFNGNMYVTKNSNIPKAILHSVIRPDFASSHTHNYNTFVYFGASHPHYSYFKCSCGEVKVDYSKTNYYDQCEICNPDISLNKTETKIIVGQTETLVATISPSDANQNITWSSSNNSIATVWYGTVTPVSAGTVIITAKANGGKTATCTVTVKDSGWVKENGNWYFYKGGSKLTGWQALGKNYYHFDSNGVMDTGWQQIANSKGTFYRYYFGTNGAVRTGWQTIKNSKGVEYRYYFLKNGVMCTGFKSIKGDDGIARTYYFGANGVMRTGWQSIKNSKGIAYKYYFGANGVMRTGWQKIKASNGKTYTYYFHRNGVMLTGWQNIKNSKGVAYKYYFGTNGVMRTGWQWIANSKGVKYRYFFGDNGYMRTGWQKLKATNGKTYWYYFFKNGVNAISRNVTIGKKTYKFNKYGICTNP